MQEDDDSYIESINSDNGKDRKYNGTAHSSSMHTKQVISVMNEQNALYVQYTIYMSDCRLYPYDFCVDPTTTLPSRSLKHGMQRVIGQRRKILICNKRKDLETEEQT